MLFGVAHPGCPYRQEEAVDALHLLFGSQQLEEVEEAQAAFLAALGLDPVLRPAEVSNHRKAGLAAGCLYDAAACLQHLSLDFRGTAGPHRGGRSADELGEGHRAGLGQHIVGAEPAGGEPSAAYLGLDSDADRHRFGGVEVAVLDRLTRLLQTSQGPIQPVGQH